LASQVPVAVPSKAAQPPEQQSESTEQLNPFETQEPPVDVPPFPAEAAPILPVDPPVPIDPDRPPVPLPAASPLEPLADDAEGFPLLEPTPDVAPIADNPPVEDEAVST
jgi:hypothetical protein